MRRREGTGGGGYLCVALCAGVLVPILLGPCWRVVSACVEHSVGEGKGKEREARTKILSTPLFSLSPPFFAFPFLPLFLYIARPRPSRSFPSLFLFDLVVLSFLFFPSSPRRIPYLFSYLSLSFLSFFLVRRLDGRLVGWLGRASHDITGYEWVGLWAGEQVGGLSFNIV